MRFVSTRKGTAMTPSRLAPSLSRRRAVASLAALGSGLLLPAWGAESDDTKNTYDQESTLKAVEDFFGSTTEGLAKVVEKVFKEQGRPNAYVKGEEVSAAITVGLRYGEGELTMKSGGGAKVYWTGPSIGFDFGANASKVFTLVYHLRRPADIFQRFPGVDGSLYFVGGAGVNYQRRGSIVLAPIRLGVGVRTGAAVGYMHYTRKKTWNPI
jgi:hypothetical protein